MICIGLLGLALWTVVGSAQAHTDVNHHCSLAVVKMGMIMRSAPQAEAASKGLHARFAEREEALAEKQEAVQKAEDEYLKKRRDLSDNEQARLESQLRVRQRELRREREDLREEVRVAKDQALSNLQKTVAEAIEAIRARENIDIVFRENDFIVASQRVDITAKVLAYLRQKFEKFSESGNIIPEPTSGADK